MSTLDDLRDRLNEALLAVQNGEYFRSRIHGWLAYREDADVQLPESLASRLTSSFSFSRPANAEDVLTLDAFVLAYHAAGSLSRQMLALIYGSGPNGSPLIALTELKAGLAFNARLANVARLPDAKLSEVLDFLFLPSEMQAVWRDEPPTIVDVQQYLLVWFRALANFVAEWRNPYNAAKHGLAVGARPTQFRFVAGGESRAEPVTLIDGPTLRTVEYEPVLDSEGKATKGSDGKRAVRWFWVYRAVDPEELIAQAIVTADLLDRLRTIATGRLLGREKLPVMVRSEPKPLEIRRRTSPGIKFRLDIASVPLSPKQADAVLSNLDGD